LAHVHRVALGFGKNRDGRNAELLASSIDAQRDLTAIGDQDLREGGRHGG
jgi:uncharacterized protein (DUF934 family)